MVKIHTKKWLKIIFCFLLHFSLLALYIKVYLVNEISDFIKGRTTISHRFEKSDQVELPTLTICMDPPLKPSLASKFGLISQYDIHFKDLPNMTTMEKWNHVSYVMNRDFVVYIYHTLMHEGVNELFVVERIITSREGTCWAFKPKSNISSIPLITPFKIMYVDMLKDDSPHGVSLYILPQKNLL